MADQSLKIRAPGNGLALLAAQRLERQPGLPQRARRSVSDLDTLAKQIDAAHVEVLGVLLTSVQWAAEAGHLLAQAKEQVPHGQWETWVAENTAVSPRTARGYMQASRFWTEADKAKRRALADLGLQGLLAKIAESRCTPTVEPEDSTAAPAEPKTFTVRMGSVPAEDSERAGGPEQDRLAATMKSIREAEERSAAPRESRFNKSERLEFRRSENLDAAKRAYLRLDKADQQEFRNWTAEGASAPVKIIDVVAT